MVKKPTRAAFLVLALVLSICALALPAPPVSAGAVGFTMTDFSSIVVEPTTGRVFVSGDNRVAAFSPQGLFISAMTGIMGASALAVEDGTVYVIAQDDGSIVEIDPVALTVIDEHEIPTHIGDTLVVLGDRAYYVAPSPTFSSLAVHSIDLATDVTANHGGHFSNPLLAEVPGRTDRLLLATRFVSPYNVYDLDITGATIAFLEGTPTLGSNLRDMVVAGDASKLWVTAGSSFDAAEFAYPGMTATEVHRYSTAKPTAVASSPAGLVAVGGPGGVLVYPDDQSSPTHTLTPTRAVQGNGVELAADGSRVYAVTEGATAATKELASYPLAPVVNTVTPSQVVTDVPTPVTLTGTGLNGVDGVTIAGIDAGFELVAPETLEVTSPPALPLGMQTIEVTSSFGSATASLQVVANTGAVLSGVVTGSGAGRPGIELTLSGGGLDAPMIEVTDALGTYGFAGVPYGDNYRVSAHDPAGGFVDQAVTNLVLEPNLSSEIDIVLSASAAVPKPGSPIDVPLPGGFHLVVDDQRARVYLGSGDEVWVFDFDGHLVGRVLGQVDAVDLAFDGEDSLFVRLGFGHEISHIDLTTMTEVDRFSTGGSYAGGLAFAGGRLWFAVGDSQNSQLHSLDPTTSVDAAHPVVMSGGAALTGVPDAPDVLFVGTRNEGVVRKYSAGPTLDLLATSDGDLPWLYEIAASATADRVWTGGGEELDFDTLDPTGVTYPTDSGLVSHSPALGGLLAFRDSVLQVGGTSPTHNLFFEGPGWRSAFSTDGRRLFTVTGADQFFVTDLAPAVTAVDPDPLVAGVGGNVTLTGNGLGVVTAASVDGVDVPFTLGGVTSFTLHVPDALVPLFDTSLEVVLTSEFGTADPAVLLQVDAEPPGPPVDVTATVAGDEVTVSWNPPLVAGTSAVTSYDVTVAGVDQTVPVGTTEVAFSDIPLGTWTASVRALSEGGAGPAALSNEVAVAAPTKPAAVAALPGPGTIELLWDPPVMPGSSPVDSYEIRIVGDDEMTVVAPEPRSLTIFALEPGSEVTYEVRARSAMGASPWAGANAATPTALMPLFPDVGADHPFYWEIWWGTEHEIVAGFDDGTFRPGGNVSRQAVVAWLWRMAGSPDAGVPSFPDVSPSNPFAEAIAWADETGVVAGYPDGTFRPTEPVSRQAMVTFLWRGAGSPGGPFPDPGFSDVDDGHPFETAIRWAVATGVANGFADGTFRPTNKVTRQAAIAFLARGEFPEWVPVTD